MYFLKIPKEQSKSCLYFQIIVLKNNYNGPKCKGDQNFENLR